MPHTAKHAPGTLCWIELATTDQNAAKAFYGSVLGWSIDDRPMGPGEVYTMFQQAGKNVGAAYTIRGDELAMGVPSHWNLYIATANADDTASLAAKLGGKVLAPPFDVMDVGRMAVIQDPTEAVFCIWQANKHQGVEIAGEDGALCWADLSTPDPERARHFYADLFGWKIATSERDSSRYLHIQNGEEFIGGIPPAAHRNPNTPAHWLIYIQVADVDRTAGEARQAGATLTAGPMSIDDVGRLAVVTDPQGAVFAIFKAAASTVSGKG